MEYTVDQVREMPLDELLPLMENKIGRQLDSGTSIFMAMAKGAGSVNIIDLNDPGKSGDQSINWEELTSLLNQPDAEWIQPYTGPRLEVINHQHFVETLLFANEITDPWKQIAGREPEDADISPLASLLGCFQSLLAIAKNYERTGYHYKIWKDFVPHSFYFECYNSKEQREYNGGIIYSEYGNRKCWSVHT